METKTERLESLRYDVIFEGFQWVDGHRDAVLYLRRPCNSGEEPEPVILRCRSAKDVEIDMTWRGVAVGASSWDIDYVGNDENGWYVQMDFRPHGSIRLYCSTLRIEERSADPDNAV